MVAVLVRLKLKLLRSGLQAAGISGLVAFVFAGLLAAGFGALGAVGMGAIRFVEPETATTVATAAFAALLFVWVFGPIVTATSEGTLPVERLVVYPLSAVQLMPGLVAASAVGFGGLATVITLIGALVGLVPVGPLAAVAVAAVAVQLATCVTCSRLVGTLISGAARTRKWRDVALVAGPLLAFAINLAIQGALRSSVPSGPGEPGDTERLVRMLRWAGWMPSGPAARAAGFAREGRAAAAIAELFVSLVVLVVAVLVWYAVLQRTLTSAGLNASTTSRGRAALFPWFARWLPRGRVGAVAAKELRLTWRDPRQRVAFFGSMFAPALFLMSLRFASLSGASYALVVAAPAYMVGASSTNLFGYDGKRHWMNVVAPGSPRDDLAGKCIARLVIGMGVALLAVPFLVWRTGSIALGVASILFALGSLAIGLAMGLVVSVRSPFPMPEATTNVFSSGNAGQGFAAAGSNLAVLFGSAALVAPFAVGIVIADTARARLAIGAIVVLVGYAVWHWAFVSAARAVADGGADLLAKLVPRE